MSGDAGAFAADSGGSFSGGGVCGIGGAELSFAPSTLVATPSGEQAIGSLKVGDTVLAYNPATGKTEPEPVQAVWRNLDHDLVDVQLTLAGSPTAGASGASANSARGATKDNASATSRTAATPTRLHRWVASGVLAAGLGATLLTTPIAPAQAAGATTTTTAPPATQTEVIHTTANHPWLTTDRGWAHAGDLRPGERVVTLPGQAGSASAATTATVAWVRAAPGAGEMDNLTVAQDHTYAVGNDHYVVHNDNWCELPALSEEQIQNGLAEAEEFRGRNAAGAVVKLAGDDNFIVRAPSGEVKGGSPGPFAPSKSFTPWQQPGMGNCAEFYCSVHLGVQPGQPLDMFVSHYDHDGPCPSCASTLQQWANANQAPIRVFWSLGGGLWKSHVWVPMG